MTRTIVDNLLFQLDAAFDGKDWHSLLGNLDAVTPEGWCWVPPRGHRSISDIVRHVGGCKIMYEHYAFGDATLSWDHPHVMGDVTAEDFTALVSWLRESHARLRRSIADLDDAELAKPRLTNWGEPRETLWIVTIMIQHDIYHAGEINHIRSLYRRDDRWEYERES